MPSFKPDANDPWIQSYWLIHIINIIINFGFLFFCWKSKDDHSKSILLSIIFILSLIILLFVIWFFTVFLFENVQLSFIWYWCVNSWIIWTKWENWFQLISMKLIQFNREQILDNKKITIFSSKPFQKTFRRFNIVSWPPFQSSQSDQIYSSVKFLIVWYFLWFNFCFHTRL